MDKRANVLLALSKCIEESGCLNEPECPYVPTCFSPGRHEILPVELIEDIRAILQEYPEPKRGRWIYHDDDYYPWLECSECHWEYSGMKRNRYCPNCGARMDGGDDDE